MAKQILVVKFHSKMQVRTPEKQYYFYKGCYIPVFIEENGSCVLIGSCGRRFSVEKTLLYQYATPVIIGECTIDLEEKGVVI